MNIADMLNIRYVKLHFYLEITEDCTLPCSKAPAIRGGMGEMLLRANCIRDRKCDECDFFKECIVQRTMYSQIENVPDFMNSTDSVGYIIDCNDFREHFKSGDTLRFDLTLFGKTICYFNQYMQAIYALGQNGLGKDKARFVVARVTNSDNQDILIGNDIYMNRYEVHTLADYVAYRKKQLKNGVMENIIEFRSPLTVKYNGEFLKEFSVEPVTIALLRRLYILACFEGIMRDDCMSQILKRLFEECDMPVILEQEISPVTVKRYSTRKDQRIALKGIKGYMKIDKIQNEMLDLYLAAEIIHIGKSTSFGFGKIRVR